MNGKTGLSSIMQNRNMPFWDPSVVKRILQEAVLAMTERIDSLLQFGGGGSPLVMRVSLVVEKAIAPVKS
jgi:hypothetical protein